MGSRSRKRRRIALIVGAVVVMLGLASVSVEAWRQCDIAQAKSELRGAEHEAAPRFAGVDDWEQWYRDRVNGSCGADAFRGWNREIERRDESRPPLDNVSLFAIENCFEDGKAEGLPPALLLEGWLKRTDDLAAHADELASYDQLLGLPEFRSGKALTGWEPGGAWTLSGWRMLRYRIYVAHCIGDSKRMWADVRRCLEIARRMRTPLIQGEEIDSGAYNELATDCLLKLCECTAPPADWDYSDSPSAGHVDPARLLESDLALYLQLDGRLPVDTDPELHSYFQEYEHWFSWTVDRNIFIDPEDEFFFTARLYRRHADYVHELQPALDALESGHAPATTNQAIREVLYDAETLQAQLGLYDQRIELALRLRRAEAAGTPLAEAIRPDAEYPDLVCTPTANGLAISWRNTPEVAKAFRDHNSGQEGYVMRNIKPAEGPTLASAGRSHEATTGR
ncbi:MAG: hypothetical protein KDB82_13175 [Planctomycetes bacterium]|nr:hypothetical protein [Planctomycetota bacterium]